MAEFAGTGTVELVLDALHGECREGRADVEQHQHVAMAFGVQAKDRAEERDRHRYLAQDLAGAVPPQVRMVQYPPQLCFEDIQWEPVEPDDRLPSADWSAQDVRVEARCDNQLVQQQGGEHVGIPAVETCTVAALVTSRAAGKPSFSCAGSTEMPRRSPLGS